MTAQQKALDLFNDYYSYLKANLIYDEEARQDAKVCALIAVDKIIESHYKVLSGVKPSFYDYWIEVKLEIEKL